MKIYDYEIIRQINPAAKIICDEERQRPEKSEVNRHHLSP